jgi:CBS domain-containing protein
MPRLGADLIRQTTRPLRADRHIPVGGPEDSVTVEASMKIKKLYQPEVVTAEPTETLVDVARRMDWLGVSCLPVSDQGQMVGIISARDLLALDV